MVTSIP